MKNSSPILRIVFAALFALPLLNVLAQAPERMSYQAVIRTTSNALVINQNVGMRMSVLQGSSSGTAVYVETHTATTNANGLVSIQIGGGTVISGVFANITWDNGTFFLKAETDPNGGSNYTITATSQLISVPYALHAGNGLPAGGTEGQSITMCDGVPTWTTGGVCPGSSQPEYPAGYVHCNPSNPTQVVDVTNPVTGATWMDRNLGANRAAISSTDAEAYGSLFQWGRFADGHQCVNRYAGGGVTTSGTTSTLSSSDTPGHANFITTNTTLSDWRSPQNNNLWQGVNGINNPCPIGYRIPTQPEFQEEANSWSIANNNGAFISPLKLSRAGNRYFTGGQISDVNLGCFYWSSSLNFTDAKWLVAGASSLSVNASTNRAYGASVRCIKN
jgi:hypothetical protein